MESEDSVFEAIKKYKEEFCSILRDAMKDGLFKVAEAISSKEYIATYYKWPLNSFQKNGLPSLSSSSFQGAKEYRSLFGSKENKIIESEIGSFVVFLDFITSNEDLERRIIMRSWLDNKDINFLDVRSVFSYSIIKDAIERYIHVFDSFEYNEGKANIIIDEIQNFIFLDTLSIDIIVPILFVNFDFESYSLSDGVEVRKLTQKEHLARYDIKSYNVSVHDSVLSSATHALILKNWEVKNSPCTMEFDTLCNVRAYPIRLIDKFFASIRLVKNINTGYAQVLSLPKSWVGLHSKADLPHIFGASIRSYPTSFENYYWNIASVPLVTNNEMGEIDKIFGLLRNSEENSISLSIKRLNQCLVRDNEEDSVIDATIALEALLSDDGNQEMTHKLAMRVGALASLDESFDKSSHQAFKEIKSIYAYRSAIVHGSKKLDKKRVIKLEDNKETTTHSLAIEYLRFVLRVLLENPKYRDPTLIDSELLLGKVNT